MHVVGRGDHHGVDVLQSHHVAIGDELPGRPAVRLVGLGGRDLPPHPPRVAHRRDLDVLLLGIRVDPRHVGADAAAAAADLRDGDPVVGPLDLGVAGGRKRQRRTGPHPSFQERPTGKRTLHGSTS